MEMEMAGNGRKQLRQLEKARKLQLMAGNDNDNDNDNYEEQGQGNQCQTLCVKFKSLVV